MAKSLLRTNKEIAEIYDRNVDMIYKICFNYMKNQPDTEDMVQNTFIQMIQSNQVFENLEHEKAWLIRVSSNTCKDALKHSWSKNISLENHEKIADDKHLNIAESNEVLKIMLELPEKYKTPLYLYYYEGYDSKEIAQLMKRSASAIRNLLRAGRKKLKKKLGEDYYLD